MDQSLQWNKKYLFRIIKIKKFGKNATQNIIHGEVWMTYIKEDSMDARNGSERINDANRKMERIRRHKV
jgi:hypothetical protein